jgi:hypothetical protein
MISDKVEVIRSEATCLISVDGFTTEFLETLKEERMAMLLKLFHEIEIERCLYTYCRKSVLP